MNEKCYGLVNNALKDENEGGLYKNVLAFAGGQRKIIATDGESMKIFGHFWTFQQFS